MSSSTTVPRCRWLTRPAAPTPSCTRCRPAGGPGPRRTSPSGGAPPGPQLEGEAGCRARRRRPGRPAAPRRARPGRPLRPARGPARGGRDSRPAGLVAAGTVAGLAAHPRSRRWPSVGPAGTTGSSSSGTAAAVTTTSRGRAGRAGVPILARPACPPVLPRRQLEPDDQEGAVERPLRSPDGRSTCPGARDGHKRRAALMAVPGRPAPATSRGRTGRPDGRPRLAGARAGARPARRPRSAPASCASPAS